MNAAYRARYHDEHGDEETTLYNDGKTLRMQVRDATFSGTMFDDFEPEEGTDASALASFCLHHNALCGCTIEYDRPLPMVANGRETEAALHVKVTLGFPNARGGLDRTEVHLTLHYAGNEYRSSGDSTWF